MENLFCFECLRRQIQVDFSDKLIFSYGLSDSALPLGSRAIVQSQVSNSGAEDFAEFVLACIPRKERDCLATYADEFILGNGNDCSTGKLDNVTSAGGNIDHADVSASVLSAEAVSGSLPREFQGLSNTGKQASFAGLGPDALFCTHSRRFSCFRTISALAPVASVGLCSLFEGVTFNFFSGFLEDHILSSLSHLIEGNAAGRESINFLNLIGMPSFDENIFPGCLRHPNITPIIGIMKAPNYVYLLLPKTSYTLESVLHYSPDAVNSEWHIRFLTYQLVSALAYIHGLGIAHGNICPSNIMLTDSCWSWLCVCSSFQSKPASLINKECNNFPNSRVKCLVDDCSSHGLFADLKVSSSIDWRFSFNQWWRGELSNFEYLLILNWLAGRRWGDHRFHTVMPWVIDFSVKPDENSDEGWRDLSKSKWRLAKGDEQLDFTYSTSEIPHHVSDECLSELAVCSYKARRLPLSILRLAVRSVYEPNEYPSSMQRLYQWTPDECIPEFYCDPQIFVSLNSGMVDLSVPSWAGSPQEFIKLHRDALESKRVSHQIHHWIDIYFGYKMSGQAAVAAKNVMLHSSDPKMPQSMGRRQLFTQPHPIRQGATRNICTNVSSMCQHKLNEVENKEPFLYETTHLQELENAADFSEHAFHLSPIYTHCTENLVQDKCSRSGPITGSLVTSACKTTDHRCTSHVLPNINSNYLIEYIEAHDEGSVSYQELLHWRQKSSCSAILSEDVAKDIFSVGCILAELHLRRPLFDSTSVALYLEKGILPEPMNELPFHTKLVVEACIQRDWRGRPSSGSLLDSPYFPSTVRSSYLFLAPLQLLAKDRSRLCYAAKFAKQGALRAMGTFAAEMCAPYCLELVLTSLSDNEVEWASMLLKELLKCLRPKAVKTLILPAIQKILQATGYSYLKVSLLQESFVRELWDKIGKQTYLETLHHLVVSNLYITPHKSSASAASVLLIGSSEDLGMPITINQTILPLIHCFGKGLYADGIDALVRIGGIFGEAFIVRHMFPLIKNIVSSCVDASCANKHEPIQSWSSLAIIDSLMTIDGLVAFLPRQLLVKELTEDQYCIHVMVLMQKDLEVSVLQVAATALIAVCERIGPDLTAQHILPQLKELFDVIAFSEEAAGKNLKPSKAKRDGSQLETHLDIVMLLYPSLASILGIEKFRQSCSTWLLIEQFLLRCHNWKWEYTGESSRGGADDTKLKRSMLSKNSISEYVPAKLLLNGAGWSIPQSQGTRGTKHLVLNKRFNNLDQNSGEEHAASTTTEKHEPWFWFPTLASSWDGIDFLGRVGGPRDELPWKIRASVLYSVRAHQGSVRSLAICQDECTVFTAGIAPGFRGTVHKWDLSTIDCLSGYYGHEEIVNDICVLSSSGRIASCDGTIHIWKNKTGKLITVFSERSSDSTHMSNLLSPPSKINSDPTNILTNSLASGILTGAFDGSLYTCMHLLENADKLVAGTGNGSLRFIDIAKGQKLHLWKTEFVETGFPSIVSAICSCGFEEMQANRSAALPSWIAAGLSSGHCKLLDARCGSIIASWRAHEGYVTKLAAPEDHLLVSSSLDRTLRVWDLRRNWPSQPITFKGHTDGISDFSVWGRDVISISNNKIGLSSLSRLADEDEQHQIVPQSLFMADRGIKNLSALSSISILPFSRLFLVGTDDGYLRICC